MIQEEIGRLPNSQIEENFAAFDLNYSLETCKTKVSSNSECCSLKRIFRQFVPTVRFDRILETFPEIKQQRS